MHAINNDRAIAVQLSHISKKYIIRAKKPTLVGKFIKSEEEIFYALDNVNLTIRKGERIGVIGPNGSGKTTLLKTIAGITLPTAGSVKTIGKIVSLIDLEAGFHPDLTGEENIQLNGLLIGMSKKEINVHKERIRNFSGIGQFMKLPFYTYSSGMKFRLAFAVAVASKCQILIMDEVFLAGDYTFVEKSISWLRKINRLKNLTLVIASNDPTFIWEFAQRYIMLDHGKIIELSKKDVLSIMKKNEILWKKILPHSTY